MIARETLDSTGVNQKTVDQMAAITAKTGGIRGINAEGELEDLDDDGLDDGLMDV